MKTILCYGDSNAWGFIPAKATRYDYDIRWPGITAKLLGEEYRLIEDCISGRTTVYEDPCVKCRCGSDNLGYSLLAHAPLDMVILALGTNDLKFTDSNGSMRGIARLIDLTLNADVAFDAYAPVYPNGVKLLLIGPPVIDASIPEKRPGHALADAAHESTLLSEKYERVAKEKGIYFLDASRYVKPSPADCLHMEPEEHAKLGKAVAEKIRGIFEATNAVNKDML